MMKLDQRIQLYFDNNLACISNLLENLSKDNIRKVGYSVCGTRVAVDIDFYYIAVIN